MTSPSALLEVRDVRRSYGGVHAVDGVSFAVPEGQTIGLIGPNGAGKSTLINLLAGFERPDSGSVLYMGEDVSRLRAHGAARLGLIRTFQLSSEFARLTVMENVLVAAAPGPGSSFVGAMRGKRHWRRTEEQNVQRAWALLERFHLAPQANEFAGVLSGGQKRLLEIARALMADPKLLVLDEPLAGVAPTAAREVEDHLIALRNEGVTIILSEHELGPIERCTDSVIVMALGTVIAQGRMEELRERRDVIDVYLVG